MRKEMMVDEGSYGGSCRCEQGASGDARRDLFAGRAKSIQVDQSIMRPLTSLMGD